MRMHNICVLRFFAFVSLSVLGLTALAANPDRQPQPVRETVCTPLKAAADPANKQLYEACVAFCEKGAYYHVNESAQNVEAIRAMLKERCPSRTHY